jgi:RNA polymerase-binding protein DksA
VSPAKKTTSSRAGGSKKTAAKKTTAKKTAARKSPAKKTPAKKTTAKKTTAKTTAKKSAAKTTAKKTLAKKTPARKPAARSATKAPAKKTTTKSAPKKTTAKKTTTKASTATKKTVAVAPAPTGRRTGKPQFKTPIRKLPVKKTKTPRPAKLDKADLKRIRAELMGGRADLVKQQEELEEDSFEGTQSDLTGEVGLDEDFADAGTATFDRERDLSIRNNIRDLIEQIDRAVRRIDEGTYGTCERCGQPIDAARVKALPHASLCLDCKRREERVR